MPFFHHNYICTKHEKRICTFDLIPLKYLPLGNYSSIKGKLQ